MSILDKLLKIAGKDADGNAKPFDLELDQNGRSALRTVDVAPAGYDEASDTLKVQMSKRRVFKQTIFPRANRSTAASIDAIVPDGAIGFMAYLTFYSATGTFTTEQGIRMEVAQKGLEGLHSLAYVQTRKLSNENGSTTAVFWYPGATKGDALLYTQDAVKIIGLPVTEKIRFTISIDGTTPEFDCKLEVNWLY